MKKTLLFASILLSANSFGQLTQANEPTIGDSKTMYVLDSFATNYDAITGAGAVWDYSQTPGYFGSTKLIAAGDATTDTYASDFPLATKTMGIPGFLTSYLSSTSTERTSHGFVFEEASLGAVLSTYEDDAQTVMTYPFGLSNSVTDTYAGSINVDLIPTPLPSTGTGTATVDGQGTLKLSGLDVSNVIRYKISETTTASTFLGNIILSRVQYEYYDLANSELPIFIHTKATISGAADMEMQLVLSSVEPGYVGLTSNEEVAFNLYPNPSNGKFNLKGELANDATVQVLDQNGRIINTFNNVKNGQEFDLSSVQSGMYMVRVTSNGNVSTKQLVIK